MRRIILNNVFLISFIILPLTIHAHSEDKPSPTPISKATIAPQVDGVDDDSAWMNAKWHQLDQIIIGTLPTKEDFSARYKAVWTEQKLYVLAEIEDDILIDQYSHPLESYWNDDTFEVLIDEDNSGGNHLNNYNAFAYHIALDNQAVDINLSGEARLINDHIQSTWKRSINNPNKVIWEVSIDIYPDTFKDLYSENETHAKPVILKEGKKMGFMIAYCDNDGSKERDNFITSIDIAPVDNNKNRAYIDASVFETVILVD